ncbi:ATP-binding protein [Bacillus pseudomycoides]|uniref:ATP-binding protein n=2 Tax=Bacillus pseudomycoides TaxID=64104 RepID=UPI00068EE7FF|nr:ATP-binding protein [Bacillus pseudomycoides]
MCNFESEMVIPDASSLIYSLRSMGYSLEAAVADIVDNSLDAKATIIDIDIVWSENKNYIRIEDNGIGMDLHTLIQAMKIGSKSPLDKRDKNTLGRFGMGLKTASFSLGKRLTVKTKDRLDNIAIRCWDLDYINETNTWSLLKQPINEESENILGNVSGVSGTIVLIELLDRVVDESYSNKKVQKFYEKVNKVEEHLSMVFHRFLEGINKVKISLNENKLEAWDPFLLKDFATQELPIEQVPLNEDIIKIQSYILPHHTKLTKEEYERAAGPNGWLEQQGFYIYRNKRLLVAGSWLRLFGREEACKLARIKIDISNGSDFDWQINIMKSTARPPQELIKLLRNIGERSRNRSHEVYYQRGVRNISVTKNTMTDHVWEQITTKKNSYFRLNRSNDILDELLKMNPEISEKLKFYLFHVEEYCPANIVNYGITNNEESTLQELSEEVLRKIENLVSLFKGDGFTLEEIIDQIQSYEMFRGYSKELLSESIVKIYGGSYV